jgi:hypothetical protein
MSRERTQLLQSTRPLDGSTIDHDNHNRSGPSRVIVTTVVGIGIHVSLAALHDYVMNLKMERVLYKQFTSATSYSLHQGSGMSRGHTNCKVNVWSC